MKLTKKNLLKTSLSTLCLMIFSVCIAAVPNDYKANYNVQNDWQEISRIFVQIEANSNINEETPQSTFASLYNHFSNVFPKFPQEYSFQVVYERCLHLTRSL